MHSINKTGFLIIFDQSYIACVCIFFCRFSQCSLLNTTYWGGKCNQFSVLLPPTHWLYFLSIILGEKPILLVIFEKGSFNAGNTAGLLKYAAPNANNSCWTFLEGFRSCPLGQGSSFDCFLLSIYCCLDKFRNNFLLWGIDVIYINWASFKSITTSYIRGTRLGTACQKPK